VQRFLILAAVFASACSAHDAPHTKAATADTPGSIEGDVYLTMQTGDVKRAAGRMVYLVREQDSLELETGKVCSGFLERLRRRVARLSIINDTLMRVPMTNEQVDIRQERMKRIIAEGSADEATVIPAINAALVRWAVDTSGTGMNAHYRFPRVPTGRYLLFADFPILTHHYAWGIPLQLRAGQALRRDLDASSENGSELYCGVK
jgi:hypothetical protein